MNTIQRSSVGRRSLRELVPPYGFAVALAILSVAAAADPPASPLSPAEALKHFQLDPACRIELVAAEPEVVDPVDVRFDEDGRMWVVEMRDYPHGPAKGEPGTCRIKVLEDRDGDGRYETATVFADKLLFATGIQPWRGGVFVTLAGRVAYMKDTNGDGRADIDETWFTGFAQENSQLRANHPRLALDNHIYVANGLRGGKIVDARKPGSKPIDISGMDFRFDPLTGEAEAVSGNGQFGLTFDDYGNRFVCSNRNPLRHVVLEQRYLKQNPLVAVPDVCQDVAKPAEQSRVFPISRAWTTSNLHAGQFTAACGVEIYRGDALPKEFYGNAFTCEPTGNLVHREIMKPAGATFTSEPAYKDREFLASTDEWFRPVNLTLGPDGALYVVDMYRAVIEHPDFMPDELKKRPDLLAGNDRGRIWRIVAKDRSANPPPASGRRKPAEERRPQLSKAKSKDLVKLLEHSNAWWRETAQRLLVERHERSSGREIEDLAKATKQNLACVHALWTLRGLGVLSRDTILSVGKGAGTPILENTFVLLEPWLASAKGYDDLHETLKEHLSLLPNSTLPLRLDKKSEFQLLLAYSTIRLKGQVKEKDGGDMLRAFHITQAAMGACDDVWARRATAIAVRGQGELVLIGCLRGSSEGREGYSALLGELAKLASPSLLTWKEWLAALKDQLPEGDSGDRIRRVILLGFAEALQRNRSSLAAVITSSDNDTRVGLQKIIDDGRKLAVHQRRPQQDRFEAVALLAQIPESLPTLLQLATTDPSQEIRRAAISALSQRADPPPWKTMLQSFSAESPTIRRALLDAVLMRPERTQFLLDELAAGRIKPAELDRAHVDRLLKHSDAKIRERAAKVLADAVPADRQKVLADYQVVLAMAGDARRGSETFKKNCATCHRIGEMGVNVAPDISDSRVKSPAQLLTDILQPNRAIDANYVSYSLLTTDGRQLTGIIAAETATSVTLRQQEGKTTTLLRSEIEKLGSNGISLMPEGLEKTIPPQEMADVIAFIKNWRYLDGRTPLGNGR